MKNNIRLYRWEYVTYLGIRQISKGFYPDIESFAMSISPYSSIIGPVLSTEKKQSIFNRIQSWQKPFKNGGKTRGIVQYFSWIRNWHTLYLKKFG